MSSKTFWIKLVDSTLSLPMLNTDWKYNLQNIFWQCSKKLYIFTNTILTFIFPKNSAFFYLLNFQKEIHPKLDLVNFTVKPLLFTKSNIVKKWNIGTFLMNYLEDMNKNTFSVKTHWSKSTSINLYFVIFNY